MTTSGTESRVLAVVRRSVKGRFREKVSSVADLRHDLGLDSLGIVAMLFSCEEEFASASGFAGRELNIQSLRTVGDVVTVVDALLAEARSVD